MLVNTTFQIFTRERSVMPIFIDKASCTDVLLLNIKPIKMNIVTKTQTQ